MTPLSNTPPIREPNRRNTDKEKEDLTGVNEIPRNAPNRPPPVKPFKAIADTKEELREDVKSFKKKFWDKVSKDKELEGGYDTEAVDKNDDNGDQPVFNTRDTKGDPNQQDQTQSQGDQPSDTSSWIPPTKEAAMQPVEKPGNLTPFSQLTPAKTHKDLFESKESPFALYKKMNTGAPPTIRSERKKSSDDDQMSREIRSGKNRDSLKRSEVDEEARVSGDGDTAYVKDSAEDENILPVGKKMSAKDAPSDEPQEAMLTLETSRKREVSEALGRNAQSYEQLIAAKTAQRKGFDLEASSEIVHTKAKTDLSADKKASRFQQEQTDSGYLTPLSSTHSHAIAQASEGNTQLANHAAQAQLLKLVEQVAKELHNIEMQGHTNTIVVLSQPPVFENARVVVSSFDSATKEFNLAFENLTIGAKRLLDANMDSLRTTLEQQGYAHALHIVTTTTTIEHHLPGEEHGDREQQKEGQGNPKQQQHESPNDS